MGDTLMTDMSKIAPAQESTLIHLRDSWREVEFEGRLLSEVSTDNNNGPRWTEMELYVVTAGPNVGKYVLSVMGRSVVYHKHNSTCNSGVPVAVRELDEEHEPCHNCNPPRWSQLTNSQIQTVDLEEDRPKVDVVADPAQLLDKLRNKRDNSISGPGQRLLAIAAFHEDGSVRDEKIHGAINRVDRL